MGIRWWDYGGSLVLYQDHLRLTQNIPGSKGYIWNRPVCCTTIITAHKAPAGQATKKHIFAEPNRE